MRRFAVVFLTLAATVSACAPMANPGEGLSDRSYRPCFLPQTTRNFTTDDAGAYLRVGRSEVYELRTGGCVGLSAARSLRLSSLNGGGGRVCVGDTVDLITVGPSLGDRDAGQCRATIARRLSDADIALLPRRLRP